MSSDITPKKEDKEKIPTRRVRMLMVHPNDFLFLFTKGIEFRKHTKLIEGIPEDAQLVALAGDSSRNGIMLVVESKTYKEIPINQLPPVQLVSIKIGIDNATKKKKSPRKK